MRVLSFIVFLTITSLTCYSGEVDDVLKNMQERFTNAKNIEYKSALQLFKGHSSTEIHTEYDAYLYKFDTEIYQKIKNTEMISGKNFFLQVSHDEKAMLLTNPTTAIQQTFDIDAALGKSAEKTITDKTTYWSVMLKFKATANSTYSIVKLRIAKDTYYLNQIDVYFSNIQDFSTNSQSQELAKPHLRMKFSEINTNPVENKSILSLSTYLSESNKSFSPQGVCAGYDIIDNRI